MLSIKQSSTVNLKPLMNIDMSPVLNDGAEIVRKDIRARFQKSIDIEGSALAALKPATIEQKKKALSGKSKLPRFTQHGFDVATSPSKPLIRFGNLAGNQLIQKATKAIQRAVVYISTSGANYNGLAADELYGFHHEGAGNLPARQPFGLSDDSRKGIANVFHARIRRIVFSLGK